MKLEFIYNKLFSLLFLSLLFESISIFTFGDFNITFPFIIVCLILIFSIFRFFLSDNYYLEKNRLILSSLLLLLILLSSLLTEMSVSGNSTLLYCFYLIFFITSRPTLKVNDINKTIKIFIGIATFLSLYGIYQFLALNIFTSLPLKELIPESWLAEGYNTNAIAYVGDIPLNRAHSIYLEPSTLSQIAATCILFLFFLISKNNHKKKNYILIVIHLIAIICSLSGTGLILLAVGIFYYAIKKKRILFLIVLALIGFFFIYITSIMLNLDIFSYFLNRIIEFNPDSVNSSGYYRFILPIIIGFKNMLNHFFGYGCGTDGQLLLEFGAEETSIANGYGKIFVELGIIGLILFIVMILSMKPRGRYKTDLLNILFIIVLVYPLLGGSLVQPSFWAYASFLMCNTFVYKSKILVNKEAVISESFTCR